MRRWSMVGLLLLAGMLLLADPALAQAPEPPGMEAPPATEPPAPPPAPGPPPADLVEGLVAAAARSIWTTLLTSVLTSVTELARTLRDQRIAVDTPAEWTYAHPLVRQVHGWLAGLMTGAAALAILAGALHVPLRRRLAAHADSPEELLARVAWGLLGVWTCLPLAPIGVGWAAWLIEFNNSLVQWLPRREASFAQLLQPLSAPTADNGFGWLSLLLLVLLGLCFILYAVIVVIRIGALQLLLATAPLFLLCWLLPPTRGLARLWVRTFLLTVYLQALQWLVIGLAVGGLAPVATGQDRGLLGPVLGLAGLLLAIRLPRELGVQPVAAAGDLVTGLATLPGRVARLARGRR